MAHSWHIGSLGDASRASAPGYGRPPKVKTQRPGARGRGAAVVGLVLSVSLLLLGAWAAVRQWRAAEGLLSAAIALPAIVYALLTYYLLGASRDQVAVLQAQIHEERTSRKEEHAAADRAHELAQATLRETARGRLSAQAPTVVVRFFHVRGDWYKPVTGGERQQVSAPVGPSLRKHGPISTWTL
jgi:hypothetical protein